MGGKKQKSHNAHTKCNNVALRLISLKSAAKLALFRMQTNQAAKKIKKNKKIREGERKHALRDEKGGRGWSGEEKKRKKREKEREKESKVVET